MPFRLSVPNGVRIYQTSFATSRNVIGVNWVNQTNNIQNSIEFDWRILEIGDSIKIQFIYGGNTISPINVDCAIVGQKALTEFKRQTQKTQDFNTYAFCILFFGVTFASLPVAVSTYNAIKRKYFPSIQEKKNKIFGLSFTIAFYLICVVIYFSYAARLFAAPQPPFGP